MISAAVLLSGCLGGGDGGVASPLAASIRYTTGGVPHIKADSFAGAGYGYGYAFAKENLCLYAEELVTLRGERAQYFGMANGYLGQFGTTFGNVDSDFFYRLLLTADQVAKTKAAASTQVQGLLSGFAAGYNRYLRDTPAAQLPAACAGKPWLRPMTESDAYLRVLQAAITASSLGFIGEIGSAQPPTASKSAKVATAAPVAATSAAYESSPIGQALSKIREHEVGSNGYGLGSDVTDNGRGLLLANPHFPWWGVLRLNQLHLTVANENYDVNGATLLGVPLPLIGFNSKLAWTHTLSTDNRFTLRYLALDPASPTRYIKDGQSVAMTAVPLTINGTAADGSVVPITRTLYTTEYGPMLMDSSFTWSTSAAFAIQDANLSNYKLMDQLLLNGKADSVDSLRQASATYMALPWVNTVAADSAGQTLFANYSVAANVSDAQLLGGCVPGASVGAPFDALLASTGVVVLSGTTAACDWRGAVPAADRPWVKRSDYVLNTNDSHWWPSLDTFLTGFRKIIATGPNAEGQLQNNRTQTGHAQVQDRLAGTDGLAGKRFNLANLQQVLVKTRFLRAERWLPDFTTACLASTNASAAARDACTVLQDWDKTHGMSSQGAILFQELYLALGELNAQSWWAVPFDPANPMTTPRGAANTAAALAQLETLVASTQFDTPQKRRTRPQDVQILVRADGNIAVPGGAKTFYNWNGQKTEVAPGNFIYTADPLTQAGAAGNSYIQFVTWDSAGPVAEGLLTYGQSSNPASPFYSDQTRKYAAGQWNKLPYTEAQIKADAGYSVVDIAE
ncbi:hypothetical protein RD110_20335 [Rhodoferax koreense]|uniref:Acylase n=2 Tax=Rhodoferax koreensis TaxID=1842727 RepID=A0A1P8K009_9BURK|nr:hypothetical protein RD110_20335 [Rhodoferax koreense]